MWALLSALAVAGAPRVVLCEGPLRPGVEAPVQLSVDPSRGLSVEGGVLTALHPSAPGIWEARLTPGTEDREVRLTLGGEVERLPVELWPASGMEVPGRVVVSAEEGRAQILVKGQDLPAPADLQVSLAEGAVRAVREVEGGLVVEVDLGVSSQARSVAFGLRDARRDESAVWGGLQVRAKLSLSYQTEPGTTLTLMVGSREYGPFHADSNGIVSGWILQYPGEVQAHAVFTDPLGNFTKAVLPLSYPGSGSLSVVVSGFRGEGLAPPVAFLSAVHASGAPWTGKPPECQGVFGPLPIVSLGRVGEWAVPIPQREPLGATRVVCHIGEASRAEFKVPGPEKRPQRLSLRVWPDEVSADFPVAEVSLRLDDGRGDPLPLSGVQVQAELGQVILREGRGEYRGDGLVASGLDEDTLRASAILPLGAGPLSRLALTHRAGAREGTVDVFVRALDVQGLPLSGEDVVISSGTDAVVATTDSRGWASALLQPEAWGEVALVAARTPYVAAQRLINLSQGGEGGPPRADLEDVVTVALQRGRVASIELDAPSVLVTGSRSVATLRVRLLDRAGSVIRDLPPVVSADRGELGDPRPLDDGSWALLFYPPAAEEGEEVLLTASSQGRTVTTRVQLLLPRVQRSAGLVIGAMSNLGSVQAPMLSADVDLRTPMVAESVMLRLGLGWYQQSDQVPTDYGQARVQASWFPLSLGLALRQEPSEWSRWVGVSAVVTTASERVWYDGDLVASGVSVLPVGFAAYGGVGWRSPGGELVFEARATSQTSSGGEAGYLGAVGGVAGLVGYRIPW